MSTMSTDKFKLLSYEVVHFNFGRSNALTFFNSINFIVKHQFNYEINNLLISNRVKVRLFRKFKYQD